MLFCIIIYDISLNIKHVIEILIKHNFMVGVFNIEFEVIWFVKLYIISSKTMRFEFLYIYLIFLSNNLKLFENFRSPHLKNTFSRFYYIY